MASPCMVLSPVSARLARLAELLAFCEMAVATIRVSDHDAVTFDAVADIISDSVTELKSLLSEAN